MLLLRLCLCVYFHVCIFLWGASGWISCACQLWRPEKKLRMTELHQARHWSDEIKKRGCQVVEETCPWVQSPSGAGPRQEVGPLDLQLFQWHLFAHMCEDSIISLYAQRARTVWTRCVGTSVELGAKAPDWDLALDSLVVWPWTSCSTLASVSSYMNLSCRSET